MVRRKPETRMKNSRQGCWHRGVSSFSLLERGLRPPFSVRSVQPVGPTRGQSLSYSEIPRSGHWILASSLDGLPWRPSIFAGWWPNERASLGHKCLYLIFWVPACVTSGQAAVLQPKVCLFCGRVVDRWWGLPKPSGSWVWGRVSFCLCVALFQGLYD